MKTKQPIYIVSRLDVLEIIRIQSEFCRIPNGSAWGNLTSIDELINAINALPRYPDDTLNMSRLSQCIQSFKITRMMDGLNRMLTRIWEIIKTKRKVYDTCKI